MYIRSVTAFMDRLSASEVETTPIHWRCIKSSPEEKGHSIRFWCQGHFGEKRSGAKVEMDGEGGYGMTQERKFVKAKR